MIGSVEEQGSFVVRGAFTYRGAAVVPTTVHWRVKCIETDTFLTDWAALTPTTTTAIDGGTARCSVQFTVGTTVHVMQTGCDRERRALIVTINRGLTDERSWERVYEVVRLHARN